MPQSERNERTPRVAVKTETIGPFRCSPQDRDEIYRRAHERNMDVTAYVTAAALGRLPEFESAEEIWKDDIQRRVERLESLAYGTS